MKLSIKVDLTPQEAREVMGLPNVKELQEKWLGEIESKVMSEAQKFMPENLIKTWTSGATGSVEGLTNLFAAFTNAPKKS